MKEITCIPSELLEKAKGQGTVNFVPVAALADRERRFHLARVRAARNRVRVLLLAQAGKSLKFTKMAGMATADFRQFLAA